MIIVGGVDQYLLVQRKIKSEKGGGRGKKKSKILDGPAEGDGTGVWEGGPAWGGVGDEVSAVVDLKRVMDGQSGDSQSQCSR